jgi:MFS family permease
MVSGFKAVLGTLNIRLLIASQFLSTFANGMFDVVFVWIALTKTQSEVAVSGMIFLRFAPYAFFGLIGGWVADRYNRKQLIQWSDGIRAAIVGCLVVGWSMGAPLLALLVAASVLLTIARVFLQPAMQGLLPFVVDRQHLPSAVAALHASNELATVMAPPLAGLLLAALPTPVALGAVAICFALGGLAVLFVEPYANVTGTSVPSIGAIWQDYKTLMAQLLQNHRPIWHALVLNALGVFGVAGSITLLIPALVTHRFPNQPEMLGSIMGLMAAGTIAGAYISILAHRDNTEWLMYIAWAVYGGLMGAIGVYNQSWSIFGLAVILGLSGAAADIYFATLVQREIDGDQLSKTFALFSTLANVGVAISAPTLALALRAGGLQFAFVASGLVAVAAGLGGVTLRRQRLRSSAIRLQC